MSIPDQYPDHSRPAGEDLDTPLPVVLATPMWPKVYRTSRLRWGHLIFPQQLILEERHIITRKRHFPMFWITREESIPYSKIGSVKLSRGLLWSTVEIENTGGVDPIIFPGLGNKQANEVRDLVEQMTSG